MTELDLLRQEIIRVQSEQDELLKQMDKLNSQYSKNARTINTIIDDCVVLEQARNTATKGETA